MKAPTQDIEVEQLANLFRLIGHPIRLSIALLLLSGPKAVSLIESRLRIRQPNLSQHLAVLRDAGVLVSSRKAKSVTYEIPAGMQRQLLEAISACLPRRAAEPAQGAVAPASPSAPAVSGKSVQAQPAFLPDEEEALIFATVNRPGRAT